MTEKQVRHFLDEGITPKRIERLTAHGGNPEGVGLTEAEFRSLRRRWGITKRRAQEALRVVEGYERSRPTVDWAPKEA